MDIETKKQSVYSALAMAGIDYVERSNILVCNYKDKIFIVNDYDKPHRLIRIHLPYKIATFGGESDLKHCESIPEMLVRKNDDSYGEVSSEVNMTKVSDLSVSIVASFENLVQRNLKETWAKTTGLAFSAADIVINAIPFSMGIINTTFEQLSALIKESGSNEGEHEEIG